MLVECCMHSIFILRSSKCQPDRIEPDGVERFLDSNRKVHVALTREPSKLNLAQHAARVSKLLRIIAQAAECTHNTQITPLMAHDMYGKETQTHPLIVSSSPHFNYVSRPHRDTFWRNLYLLLLAFSLGGALYSLINRSVGCRLCVGILCLRCRLVTAPALCRHMNGVFMQRRKVLLHSIPAYTSL